MTKMAARARSRGRPAARTSVGHHDAETDVGDADVGTTGFAHGGAGIARQGEPDTLANRASGTTLAGAGWALSPAETTIGSSRLAVEPWISAISAPGVLLERRMGAFPAAEEASILG